ncbi:MAG: excalibur calcium-binding domain-containing protein [Pseudomonadota bacterium]|nr:excalibur calcium-binding domain-containing protein [Pseudomonadota bacterium]
MKNILTIAILAAVGWYAYTKYQDTSHRAIAESYTSEPKRGPERGSSGASPAQFTCDGREHCSQMTSCAEASYFVQHCPNTKMDGDNDGIPCESQWCGR